MPPGPRRPWALQLYRYLTDPLPFFRECGERYGEIFTLRLGPMGNWVFIGSPELVKQIYTAEAGTFRPGAAKARVFGPVLGTTSSLTLDGDAHLSRRALLLPAFRGEKLAASTPLIVEVVKRAMRTWPRERFFSVHEHLQQIAFDSVLKGVFGDGTAPALRSTVQRLVREALPSPLLFLRVAQRDLGRYSPWGRITRMVAAADRAVYGEIQRRRSLPEGADILGTLLQVRSESGERLTDRELRDELVTMVVTGHEVTGLSLSWALVSLASRPRALARLRQELDGVLGERDIDGDTAGALPYLDACIRESLRLHSAVPNGSARLVARDFELGGYTLRPGTMVNVCFDLLHHRPELYPDPEVFEPERFMNAKINPYQWVPFGGGVRRCLGMAFALHEMKVVLATLLQHLDVSVRTAQLRAPRYGAFVRPSGGPQVSIRDRR